MERRKFVKYSGLASLALGFFPANSVASMTTKASTKLVELPKALTQIRHGALNLPFASGLKKDMPFDWILDVHQNIFLRDGFQRNLDQDLDITSIALKVEEGFEALQVSSQNDQLQVIWKQAIVAINLSSTFRELGIRDEIYDFYAVRFKEIGTAKLLANQNKQTFIQVLDGSVEYDDLVLTRENGLGIFDLDPSTNFQALSNETTLLVIAR